ncbi:MAG: type II secretion system major pseudopilin GspG, partial [bacterium]
SSLPEAGFTLIELLVVIVVIATLATLVAPNVFKHVGAAKDATARSQIEMLASALDAYRLDNSRYPTTSQGLYALWEVPSGDPRPANWRGPTCARPFRSTPGITRTSTSPPASRVQVHPSPRT